jgi:carbon storage regulator
MLVLSRKKNETVVIAGGDIVVTVLEIRGDKVRLGIDAPKDTSIHRSEVWAAIQRQEEEARQEQAPNESVAAG